MTVVIELPVVEADTRGIVALAGDEPLQDALWYEMLVLDMSFDPFGPLPKHACFDEWPVLWQDEDPPLLADFMSALWSRTASSIIFDAEAYLEEVHKQMRGAAGEDDTGSAGGDGSDGASPAGGGGAAVPRGSKNGRKVGNRGKAVVEADAGGASPV
jgi:hypothetical protein